jgi:hypothetical protein
MDVGGARVAARIASLEESPPWRHWLHMEPVSSALLSEHHNHLRPWAFVVPVALEESLALPGSLEYLQL